VTEVSGKVVNQTTGDPVPNAQVTLKDSAGSEHSATANGKGEFRVTPQNNKPIAAGALSLTATIEGFADGTANANGTAGKATTGVRISMKPTTASVPPSAPAAGDPGASEAPSTEATGLANPSNTSKDSGGPSMLSWLLIGVGVVLVLLGIGAIVLLLMRRKDDPDDGVNDYGDRPNQMAPAGAGAYRGADRTMVAGSPGMNDATAIVGQQQLDEFPDPYAAPPTTRTAAYGGGYAAEQATSVAPGPGYGPPGGRNRGYDDGSEFSRGEPGYGNNGYGERGFEGRGGPTGANGYGAASGGYGDSPRGRYADEPTGQYSPPPGGGGYPTGGGYPGDAGGPGTPANGYGGGGGQAGGYGGAQGAGYGGQANGYGGAGGQANGYGSGGDQANGYGGGQGGGQGNGFGGTGQANGYGSGQANGYDAGGQADGYGGAGGQANGYGPGGGQANGYGPGGGGDYGRSGGGYPSAGGYDPAERGGDPRNGRGRSVDWLD
jgi:hypothetical protein